MSRIKAIILDLDDTLFDTTNQIKEKALRRSIRAMIEKGLPCTEEEGFAKIKEIISKDPSAEKFDELAAFYDSSKESAEAGKEEYYNINIEGIHLFPGVRKTLSSLKKDYKLVLISTGKPELQYHKLEILDIKEYFDHILINQKNTKEECFLEAIDLLGIKANRIIGIGDRPDVDVKAANKLGMTSVRVRQGGYKEVIPGSSLEIADYDIVDLSEIMPILENIETNDNKLQQGPKIVVIGGGTGMPTLLEGLRKYSYNLSAVVTITDAGRSSGRLRKDLNILPPGDIRNNLIALSDSEKLMHDLFQYRFEEGDLKGHSLGNLLIAALTKITKNFETAIKEVSKILNLKGGVYPSTLHDTHICAELEDGTILNNEQEIVIKGEKLEEKKRPPIKRVFINPEDAEANASAVARIKEADIVVIGPGSLFTSVIPNLLVKGIKDAIKETDAKKVYICNIVTQPGQTEDMKASGHVKVIQENLDGNNIDYVILNSQKPSKELIEQYKEERADIVENDIQEIKSLGVGVIEEDLLESIKEKKMLWEKQYLLRHDSNKIAELLVSIVSNGNGKEEVQG